MFENLYVSKALKLKNSAQKESNCFDTFFKSVSTVFIRMIKISYFYKNIIST